MSDATRTVEEYIQHYAKQHCGGDTEKAKTHAIVKTVVEEKQKE